MLNLFKNAFRLTNEGVLLAIPLVFFIWIMAIYLSFAKHVVDTLPEALSAVVTLLFMAAAFLAGWFNMVKEMINISNKPFVTDEDRARDLVCVAKSFTSGIGKYFLSFLGLSILAVIIFIICGGFVYKLGMHFIGSIDFTAAQIKGAMASPEDMKAFLDSLSLEQLYKLGKWNLLFMAGSTLVSFLGMLWVPEILYKTLNPLTALFKSLKKLFVRFNKSLVLFIYLSFLNVVISFANTFAALHPLLYMLLMVIYFYFMVYMVVLIFSYYEKEFNGTEE